ncbi:MAG TPA: hypothetical protein VGQ09_12205 [Chitinophagaceae bacterium]|jgi:hypothetical protein|nr:hypothetical protein [Chitinophagaceae bacterium]
MKPLNQLIICLEKISLLIIVFIGCIGLSGFFNPFHFDAFYISPLIGGIASLVALAFSITRSLVALLFIDPPCRSLGLRGSPALMISGCQYIENKIMGEPQLTAPVMEC